MMKVTPIATINAGVAEIAILAKFRTEKNLGSSTVNTSTSVNSTRTGAHFNNVSRDIRPLTTSSWLC